MAEVREINISTLKDFEGQQWRQAFLYYLFGVWSNNHVNDRPTIWIDGFTIRLHNAKEIMNRKYFVYGLNLEDNPVCPEVPSESKLIVSPRQIEFEHGLVCFIKNHQIVVFELRLPPDISVRFWKNPRYRGFLGAAVSGTFPRSSLSFPPDEKTA